MLRRFRNTAIVVVIGLVAHDILFAVVSVASGADGLLVRIPVGAVAITLAAWAFDHLQRPPG